MDYFYPKENNGSMPVVIWIHGGGWSDENLTKRYRPEPELAQLSKMGFFVASIEYRLMQHAVFPAQIQDCKCAVRYLRAHAEELGIDPAYRCLGRIRRRTFDRPFGNGRPCGENLKEGEVGRNIPVKSKLHVPWYAPYDMLEDARRSEGQKDSLSQRLFGGPASEKEELIRKASPIYYAKEKFPPFLVMIFRQACSPFSNREFLFRCEGCRKSH